MKTTWGYRREILIQTCSKENLENYPSKLVKDVIFKIQVDFTINLFFKTKHSVALQVNENSRPFTYREKKKEAKTNKRNPLKNILSPPTDKHSRVICVKVFTVPKMSHSRPNCMFCSVSKSAIFCRTGWV